MSTFEYGPPRDEAETRAFAALQAQSLAPAPPMDLSWFDDWHRRTRMGGEIRLVRSGGTLAGGGVIFQAGQWVGGRPVPCGAIGGVAIAPEHRSRGNGLRLMQGILRELHETGTALSVLYPATHRLYRKAGYELAGQHVFYQLPSRMVAPSTPRAREQALRELDVRPLLPTERGLLEELYAASAAEGQGLLDRKDWVWDRILTPVGIRTLGYVIHRQGRPEGYIILSHKEEPTLRYEVHVRDMVARSPLALERILEFLGAHSSMSPSVHFRGGPVHPFLWRIPEGDPHAMRRRHDWMLRIVNVQKALEARGYARALRAGLHLEISDELIAGNAGRFTVDVSGGEARVRSGGRGEVRLDIRALAALYTGYLSARVLQSLGQLDGPPGAIEELTSTFSAPAPWMADMF